MKTGFQIDVILRIKLARESKNISQGLVASVLGVSPGQIGNIESSKMPHKYTLKQIVALCGFLGVEIESVFCPGILPKYVE